MTQLTAEDLKHIALPVHVKVIGETDPLLRTRRAKEAAVLGRHAEVVDMAKVLLEESSVATRDDVDDVLRVGGEDGEGFEQLLGGDRGGGVLDDGSEGAVCRVRLSR